MATLSTSNYTIGAADLYFEASVAHASLDAGTTNGVGSQFRTDARKFGNITDIELAPEVAYLDHYVVTQTGVRQKDLTVANELSLAVNFRFDEINTANFRKFLFGTAITNASLDSGATPAFTVMSNTLSYGSAQIYFRTGVGKDFVYMIPKCTIRPDGSMPLTTEDWISAPMVLEVFNTTWSPTNVVASPSDTFSAPYGFVSMAAISSS